MLEEKDLLQTNAYKYLGVWKSTNECERAKHEKISMTNQWLDLLGSAARMRACKYEVVREVWKSVAVPSVVYGISDGPGISDALGENIQRSPPTPSPMRI